MILVRDTQKAKPQHKRCEAVCALKGKKLSIQVNVPKTPTNCAYQVYGPAGKNFDQPPIMPSMLAWFSK